jgi:protein TilB
MPELEEIDPLTDAPIIEEADDDDDEPQTEELSELYKPLPADAGRPKAAKPKPTRDGVALTEDLIRRKAEHNEGMLSTLEEIALHQLDIDKIECLNNCRCLKIVYLQSNLIRKIEGLHRLKELDYLNLALNNITRVENLERCEALTKLDLTVNFIDLDELESIHSLKDNTMLRDFHLMGNPCVQHWESGYRDYVIATLPQLSTLDGVAITRADRIRAMQRLPELERELASLSPIAKERKAQQKAKWKERQRKIESGELVVTNETTDEWCPEVRVEDARELREVEEEKQAYRKKAQVDSLFGDQPARERRLFKEDGTPVQMNTAKWPFSIDEDGENVYVDVALPKFLDSAAVGIRPHAPSPPLSAHELPRACPLLLPPATQPPSDPTKVARGERRSAGAWPLFGRLSPFFLPGR